MQPRFPVRLATLGLLTAAVVSCGGLSRTASEDDDSEVGRVSQAVDGLPARCYGKMLKPTPLELQQPIGQAMTVRVNRTCDSNAPLVARKLRIYIRRVDVPGPQRLLMDWTDWPGSQYRFEVPWTAGDVLEGSGLVAGRYRIYS